MPGGETLDKKSKALLLCAVAVLALAIGGIYTVTADNQDEGAHLEWEGFGFPHMKGWGGLHGNVLRSQSEEQRNELASEIRDLVSLKFEEWGIEPSEPILSEEQRSELQAGIEELRETGATPEEIREYIGEQLEKWGVELSEMPEYTCRFHRKGRFMNRPSNGMWKRRFKDNTS